MSELFNHAIITTNYDCLFEQAFDTGAEKAFRVISGINALAAPAADGVSIIKLHGDVKVPANGILSRNQYDQAYGSGAVDLTLPITRLLEFHYRNSNLLFLGCSLNNDRTVHVFRAIKKHIGDAVL